MNAVDTSAARAILSGLETALVALAARGSVLFAVAYIATKTVRSLSAAARHSTWLAVLLLLAVLPAASLIPIVRVPLLDVVAPVTVRAAVALAPPDPVSPGLPVGGASAHPTGWTADHMPANLLLLIGGIWALGALLVFSRPLPARMTLARISSSWEAVPIPERVLKPLADAFAVHRVRAFSHPRVTVPFTYGILHPVIALPSVWSTWHAEQLKAVLLHELAHVRRGDALAREIARVAGALLWFHPVTWLIRSFLRREAELSCDENVLSRGISRPRYASAIIATLRQAGGIRLHGQWSTLGSAAILKLRVTRILDHRSDPDRSRSRRAAAGLVVAAGLLFPILSLSLSLRGAERLGGTWRTLNPLLPECDYVLTWNQDGTATAASSSLPDVPAARIRYAIEKKWTDAAGNTWYHVRTRWTCMPFDLYTLIRFNAAGTSYELSDSPMGYPAEFVGPPGDSKHLVYARR
jgi:beta-lactamase regulating signal transducer with metallopeptidase domain